MVYCILAIVTVLVLFAVIRKPVTVYKDRPEERNPVEGKRVRFVANGAERENADGARGHLEVIGEADYKAGFYERVVKRLLDIVLSLGGLILLSPVFLAVSLWIYIDEPGPVIFTQKRVGQNKQYFRIHKFRSMKMSTPHDIPTHMLVIPEQYITKVGRFIRRHSLDELPQIWDIFIGNMSVVGPRPGLWNQDLLTAERDKYGANDIKPGLTGWAQINGRDKLDIPMKSKFDGEYAAALKAGRGLQMDVKCFLGSLGVFYGDKNLIEGGPGDKR